MAEEVGGIAGEQLKSYIERLENLETEKRGLQDDIKDIFGEAKALGFDVKVMRQVLRLRKMAADDRREQEEILSLYLASLGME